MAPENSGENSGDQIRRDLAHHGTAFVLDGQRIDPDAITVHDGYWRVRVPGSMGEAHLTTPADQFTLCGHHRRPYDGWSLVYGPVDPEAARTDVTICLTCRGQIPRLHLVKDVAA